MSNYGLIKLRAGSIGTNISLRGSVTRNPHNVSREAVVHLDNTVDGTETAMGFRFAMSISVKGWPLLAPLFAAGEKVDFTFLHDSEKIDRVYSRAILTGDPQVDDVTGEISGITGVAEGYLEVPR